MLARCDDDEHQDGDDIEPGELVVVESERGVLRGVLVRWRRLVVRAPACAPAPTAVRPGASRWRRAGVARRVPRATLLGAQDGQHGPA